MQFSFSPAMGRGAPGLFKRLMPLADVKGAAVTQEERDRMAGGRAGVFVLFCFVFLVTSALM